MASRFIKLLGSGIVILLIGFLWWLANSRPTTTSLFDSLFEASLTGFGIRQGILTGLIFFGGVLGISRLNKFRWIAASILLVIITPLAMGGFWFSSGQLGISDWDYYFSYHYIVRNLTLTYDGIPQWNPYICGGTSAIGDPEFPLFTPTFILELLFGIPLGLRLAIYFSTIIGAVGTLILSKRLGLSVFGAMLAAVTVSFSSVNILEIVEGHTNILSAMWIPWILWSWVSAYRTTSDLDSTKSLNRWSLLCGLFLALTFLQGGIYLLMYTAGAFVFLVAVAKNHRRAFMICLKSGFWALGLASIKLVPVLYWLSQFQDQVYASSTSTLTSLHKVLLGRYLHGPGSDNTILNQGGGWHEYGAYVGPLVLVLAIAALNKFRTSRLVRLLVLGSVIALLISSAGPVLKPLFDQVAFLPRSNISRLVLFAVMPIALLSGLGLDNMLMTIFKRRSAFGLKLIASIVLGLLAIDLMTLSYQLSQQAFVLPYPEEPIQAAQKPLQFTLDKNTIRYEGADYTRAYPLTVQGWGTLSYCTVLGPSPAVVTKQQPENQSFVSSDNPAAKVELLFWSPNKINVKANLSNNTNIILNNNYARGWLANGEPTTDVSGRIAATLPAGQSELVFEYKAPGYRTGLMISVATILIALLVILRRLNLR